ncbi:hypothetical protein D4R78_03590 [bacterium]|nr:MAG: hypothetical protein D4R78_03590 [bacterium]
MLIFLILFTPLAYASITIFPLTILETTVALMILLWFLNMSFKGSIAFVKTGFSLPIFLFIGLVIFQLIPLPPGFIKLISGGTFNLYRRFMPAQTPGQWLPLSIYPEAGLAELFKLASFIGVFFLIINKVETKKQIDLIFNIIIFFGLAISLFGIIQKFSYSGRVYWFDPAQSAGSPFGPFANRNNFSGYINMIMPLGLGYFLTDMPLAKRCIYGFSVGVMSLALFLSLSRSGILVYFFTLMLILALVHFHDTFKRESMTVYIWFFLIFCLFVFSMESKAILARFSTLFKEEAFFVFGHGYSWSDIIRIWQDFPLFGTGLGTFGNISAMYKTSPAQTSFSYAHNDYLQLLSETGLIGLTLIALFFIFYFKSVVRLWFKRHDLYVISLVLGGLVSICGMLAYSLLDFNLHIPANGLLFFIIMGLVYKLVFLHPDQSYLGKEVLPSNGSV